MNACWRDAAFPPFRYQKVQNLIKFLYKYYTKNDWDFLDFKDELLGF
jgi:hypothetical protein